MKYRLLFRRLFVLAFTAAFLVACAAPAAPAVSLSPTAPPPAPTVQPVPTTAPTAAPDIRIYRNGFEDLADPAAAGITSTANGVRVNTENVDFQGGKQALEAYGTLAGAVWSALSLSLSVKALTGQDTVNLSNKTIGFSYFVPPGSPIATIAFVARAGQKEVSLLGVGADADSGNQGVWRRVQVDLAPIYQQNSWGYSALSNEESRWVIENCSQVVFAAMRTAEGEAAETGFLIDDFSWIGLGDPASFPLDASAESLRRYADERNLKLASVLFHNDFVDQYSDPWYLYTLAQEFNMTTAGGFRPPEERPADISAIEFDYTREDEKLAFAEGHGMALRAGTGGWHTDNPRWVTDGTYGDLKALLERKIESDLGHFKGRVLYWGLFNEVVLENGQGFRNRQHNNETNDPLYGTAWAPYGGNYSPWVDGTDTSLIEHAFITARPVDPQAKLFLNDSNNEEIGKPKSEFFYQFVTGMKERGIPIDGVGFQLHLMVPNTPTGGVEFRDLDAYFDRVDRNLKRYADAGLLVEFTEFECQVRMDDLDLATQAGQEEYARRSAMQVDVYRRMVRLALDNPNVVSLTIWTVADKPGTSAYDWSGVDVNGPNPYPFTYTDSFLFDRNYRPKPAYFAVLDELKGQ